MQEDLGQSLVAQSEFVSFKQNKSIELGESLVAVSEKVYFQNASNVNKQQYEKDKKYMKSIGEQVEEQSQNQFLEVGKWKKAKQNSMTKDMAAVKKQVDQIITQTRWHKKQQQEPQKEQVIADESIVPDLDDDIDKNEEIQDQTQHDDQQAQDQEQEEDEQQEQQSSEQQEQQQSEEEQEQSEQSQQQEQDQEVEKKTQEKVQEIAKQQVQMELSNTYKKQQFKVGSAINRSKTNESNFSKIGSSKKIDQQRQSKAYSSQASLDDRTDAQSQMKRTEYLPAKWNKKRQSQLQNQSQSSADPWKRKEAILKRILLLVK